jgi:hypothetical protein
MQVPSLALQLRTYALVGLECSQSTQSGAFFAEYNAGGIIFLSTRSLVCLCGIQLGVLFLSTR